MTKPYQFTGTNLILRTADNAFIPPDDGNADYQEYQAWLNSGGVPDPAPPSDPVQSDAPTLSELQQQLAVITQQINDLVAKG